jgi:hypothetical protein
MEHLDGTAHPRVDAAGSPDGTEAPRLDHPLQSGAGQDGARDRLGELQELRLKLEDTLVSTCSVEALGLALRTLALRAQAVQLSHDLDGERMRLWAATRLDHACFPDGARKS